MASVKSNKNGFPTNVKDALKEAKHNATTYKGHSGFFVSEARFESLKQLIEMPVVGSVPSEAEVAEFKKLKSSLMDREAIIKELKQDVALSQGKVNEMESKLTDLKKSASAVIEDQRKEIAQAQEKVDKLLAEKLQIAVDRDRVTKSMDVDAAQQVAEEMQRVKIELKQARDHLKSVGKTSGEKDQEILALSSEIDWQKDALRGLKNDLADKNRISNALARESLSAREPKGVFKRVVGLIGQRGLNHILEMEKSNRENARDQAYHLMLALKSSNKKPIKDIFSLVEILYTWVKNQAYKTRTRALPWIQLLAADIRAGTVRTFKEYRLALEKVLGDIKKETKTIKDRYKSRKGSWYSRLFAEFKTTLSDVLSKVKSLNMSGPKKVINDIYGAIKMLFKVRPVHKGSRNAYCEDTEQVLFDFEQMEQDELKAAGFTTQEKGKGREKEQAPLVDIPLSPSGKKESTFKRHGKSFFGL